MRIDNCSSVELIMNDEWGERLREMSLHLIMC
jgi:hypothetical protein